MIVHHLVRLWIDFVDSHARVDICPRCDGRADEGVGDCIRGEDRGSIGLVKDVEEVFVGVAKEKITDRGVIALDDDLKEVGGVLQRVGAGPAAVDVLQGGEEAKEGRSMRDSRCSDPVIHRHTHSDDPDSLLAVLCQLQLIRQEAQDPTRVKLSIIDEIPRVPTVPQIGIQRNDPQSFARTDRKGTIVLSDFLCLLVRHPAVGLP